MVVITFNSPMEPKDITAHSVQDQHGFEIPRTPQKETGIPHPLLAPLSSIDPLFSG